MRIEHEAPTVKCSRPQLFNLADNPHELLPEHSKPYLATPIPPKLKKKKGK
jgi:hypothetical protein